MQWEYKVVQFTDLMEMPSFWQMASSKMEEMGTSMQDAINRMAQDGWEYVDSIPFPGMTVYFVFRKSRRTIGRDNIDTGIKEL